MARPVRASKRRAAGPSVLIAEADPLYRALLTETFASAEYTTLVAADGAEAWPLLVRHRPRVVLLDCDLPGGDGCMLAQRLKRHPLLRPTYVILLSGRARLADIRAKLATGADAYVTKPYAPLELIHLVEQALGLAVEFVDGGRRQRWNLGTPPRAVPARFTMKQ